MEDEGRVIRAKDFILLPPRPGTCPACAVNHDPAAPHDRDSLYYQMRFYQEHGRFPTWGDAMAHCEEYVRDIWRVELARRGVAQEELRPGGQDEGKGGKHGTAGTA